MKITIKHLDGDICAIRLNGDLAGYFQVTNKDHAAKVFQAMESLTIRQGSPNGMSLSEASESRDDMRRLFATHRRGHKG